GGKVAREPVQIDRAYGRFERGQSCRDERRHGPGEDIAHPAGGHRRIPRRDNECAPFGPGHHRPGPFQDDDAAREARRLPRVPEGFSASGRVIASGSEAGGTRTSEDGNPIVTNPAPARMAPRAASTGAPASPRLPPRMITRPKRPLWASAGRGGIVRSTHAA